MLKFIFLNGTHGSPKDVEVYFIEWNYLFRCEVLKPFDIPKFYFPAKKAHYCAAVECHNPREAMPGFLFASFPSGPDNLKVLKFEKTSMILLIQSLNNSQTLYVDF